MSLNVTNVFNSKRKRLIYIFFLSLIPPSPIRVSLSVQYRVHWSYRSIDRSIGAPIWTTDTVPLERQVERVTSATQITRDGSNSKSSCGIERAGETSGGNAGSPFTGSDVVYSGREEQDAGGHGLRTLLFAFCPSSYRVTRRWDCAWRPGAGGKGGPCS